MRGGPVADRGIVVFTRIGLEQGNQLFDIAHRQVGIDGQDIGLRGGEHHRREVTQWVVGQLAVEKRGKSDGAIETEQPSVAIGRAFGDFVGARRAAGLRAVFNHDRLPQAGGEAILHAPSNHIQRAPRWSHHDPANGFRREILRKRGASPHRYCASSYQFHSISARQKGRCMGHDAGDE